MALRVADLEEAPSPGPLAPHRDSGSLALAGSAAGALLNIPGPPGRHWLPPASFAPAALGSGPRPGDEPDSTGPGPPTRREGPRLGLGGCCHGPGHGRGGINRCCPPRACSPVPGTGRSSMIGAAAFALPRSREVRYEPIGEPKLNAVRLVSNTRAATSGATLTSQISCASGDRRAVQI